MECGDVIVANEKKKRYFTYDNVRCGDKTIIPKIILQSNLHYD